LFYSCLGEYEIPIIRKIIEVGKTSRAVILPKSWLEFYEKERGERIEAVTIEVNRVLKIAPFLPKIETPKARAER